jgi:hypothetical protein
VIELGHSDTLHSRPLCVPSIGLVVSGDAVYNYTHPYLAECDDKARAEWLRALDTIEALRPHAVVAGHGVPHPDSSPPTYRCDPATAHGEHEKRAGQHDANWPDWHATYMVAEQSGEKLPDKNYLTKWTSSKQGGWR